MQSAYERDEHMKRKKIIAAISVAAVLVIAGALVVLIRKAQAPKPEAALKSYFECIGNQDYGTMYSLISKSSQNNISEEDFTTRNKNIYEGIDARNIKIEIGEVKKLSGKKVSITYNTTMDTSAGSIEFPNTVELVKDKRKYLVEWSSSLIFPELKEDYKVRVKTTTAERGQLLDRNGRMLAGKGQVSSIGIVPGKLGESRDESIEKIASLLDVSVSSINSTLSSSWVKDDTFVPIKKVPKDSRKLKDKLLEIPGVMITTVEERTYPYKEAASLLIGYVQSITKEELEKNSRKGYNSNSVIGKTGLEKQYEDRLRGTNGVEIYITDSDGEKIKTIAKSQSDDGEDIKLTIDIDIQVKLYEQLKDRKGLFVVMEPKTGELLALVSTPSYDANDFILGMGDKEWEALKNDEAKPMYNRFMQSWCPGSTFKPVTAAIGLTSGRLTVEDEFEYTGLSWQKDASWGNHMITTLAGYTGGKNMKNALIHSDNIYFAQAALKIGADALAQGLDKLLFNESIGVLDGISKSQYSNSGSIKSDTLLADSGYGQGEILVNPIHMASIYSAFENEGNMVKPYIEYKEDKAAEYIVEGAFAKEAADTVKSYLIQVVEDSGGTAHDMYIPRVTIAGKTGTAEITESDNGKETLGWFDCITEDGSGKKLLIVSMVEDTNSSRGSHYLISKIRTLFE